ncbi:MAG: hypothetical protein H6560_19585 [Lewinellaceae bacterium]|nr:hypothetical protein [Lewinellaceae bacterium]
MKAWMEAPDLVPVEMASMGGGGGGGYSVPVADLAGITMAAAAAVAT